MTVLLKVLFQDFNIRASRILMKFFALRSSSLEFFFKMTTFYNPGILTEKLFFLYIKIYRWPMPLFLFIFILQIGIKTSTFYIHYFARG
jgi:hypothetical protein